MHAEAHAEPATSIILRPMVKSDRGYFASSWLKSFRSADAVRGVERQTYFYFQHRVLERLVARSRVIMAADRREPDTIHGFVCFEPRVPTLVVHYLFTRKRYRGQGVGRALLDEARRVCDPAPSALVWTHRTRGIDRYAETYARAHELAPLYNPYLIHEAP